MADETWDIRNRRVEDVGHWMYGIPLSRGDRSNIRALRDVGCVCLWPLLGYRPGVGPRCRLCNTEATEVQRG